MNKTGFWVVLVGMLAIIIAVYSLLSAGQFDSADVSPATEVEHSDQGAGDTTDNLGMPTPVVEKIDQPAENKVNVLLIILDDIGLDYFPGFLEDQNFVKASMPRTEQLMAQGHVFENLQVYPTCSPTRASLLTGRHAIETGVYDPGRTAYLDPQWQSLQQEIKNRSNQSVATAVFGKWHLLGNNRDQLDHPSLFGIDHYEGMIEGNHDDYSNWTRTINGKQDVVEGYSTTVLTDAAIDWIANQDGQWFTWLAYTAPHSPIHLPPLELHSFDDLSGTDQDIRRNGDQYFMAMLESVDTEIGRLLDSFDQKTRDNTYICLLYTSPSPRDS